MKSQELIKEIEKKIEEYMSEVTIHRCIQQLGRYCLDCEINQAKATGLQEAIEIINKKEAKDEDL